MKKVIEVKNISKSFKVFYDKSNLLKERVLFRKRNSHKIKPILNNISFSVKKGETIGIIGRNGCGKSTLLKLLTKIMYPNSGSININGKVSSLIELGAGFHPDMSGRDNIYTNASIYGLTKKEIDSILDTIIEFSELEKYIDNPVRTYSSGMYMRLAFSIAIHVNADILLIDEILAVGDISFQKKCLNKLRELKKEGVTVIIVSHSLEQVEEFCDRAIWIEDGIIKEDGPSAEVANHYRIFMLEDSNQEEKNNIEKKSTKEIKKLPDFCDEMAIREGNRKIEFTNVQLIDINGNEKKQFEKEEPIVICIEYKSKVKDLECNFGIAVSRDDGIQVYGTNIFIEKNTMIKVKDKGKIKITIEGNHLLTAEYLLDLGIRSADSIKYDHIKNVKKFNIVATKRDIGICRLDTSWEIDGKKI